MKKYITYSLLAILFFAAGGLSALKYVQVKRANNLSELRQEADLRNVRNGIIVSRDEYIANKRALSYCESKKDNFETEVVEWEQLDKLKHNCVENISRKQYLVKKVYDQQKTYIIFMDKGVSAFYMDSLPEEHRNIEDDYDLENGVQAYVSFIKDKCSNELTIVDLDEIRQNGDILVNDIPGVTSLISYVDYNCENPRGFRHEPLISALSDYCEKNFETTYLDSSVFKVKVDKVEDKSLLFPYGENYGIDKILGDTNPWINTENTKTMKENLKSFYNTKEDFYMVSVYMSGENKEILVSRWFFTKNNYELKNDELLYWNYCEAGCHVLPFDVYGDYIVWKKFIQPGSGVSPCYGFENGPLEDTILDDELMECTLVEDTWMNYDISEVN